MNVLWRSLARMSAKLIFLLSVAGCFGTLAYASEGGTAGDPPNKEQEMRSFYESVNKANQEREYGITGRQSRNKRDSSTWPTGHPESAASAMFAWFGDQFYVYMWRADDAIWLEVEPLVSKLFICGPSFDIFQDGSFRRYSVDANYVTTADPNGNSIVKLETPTGDSQCGDIQAKSIYKLRVWDFLENLVDIRLPFTLYFGAHITGIEHPIFSLDLTGNTTVNPPVTTNQPPVASFTVTPAEGEAPLKVIADANGSNDPDGTIVEYRWFIGAQRLSDLPVDKTTVDLTFNTPTTYNIQLTVVDDKGATAIIKHPVTVTGNAVDNVAPIADFTFTPEQGTAPLTVALDAGISSDPDGSIADYQWSVNGQTLSGKTVSVTLDKAGNYPITLTVTDDKGLSATKTNSITVIQPTQSNSEFCTSGNVNVDLTGIKNCVNDNCSSPGVKITCNNQNCQWCDASNNCGNILYAGVTSIPGGSISCTNGQCSYSIQAGGVSLSDNFNCKSGSVSQPTTVNTTPANKVETVNPVVSKSIYQDGDQVKITIPKTPPTGQSQYFGIELPNNMGLFLAKNLNEFYSFDGSTLLEWQGGDTVIDIPVTPDLPRGKYTAYLLRSLKGIDPLKASENQSSLGVNSFVITEGLTVGLIITQITDSNTNLGLVVTSSDGMESTAIYGDKDANGNLKSITDFVYTTKNDIPQGAAPQAVQFKFGRKASEPKLIMKFPSPDGNGNNEVRFTDYDPVSKRADLVFVEQDANGQDVIVNTVSKQPLPEIAQNFEDSQIPQNPQGTQGSPTSCYEDPLAVDLFTGSSEAIVDCAQKWQRSMIQKFMGMLCDVGPGTFSIASWITGGGICNPYKDVPLSKPAPSCTTEPISNLNAAGSTFELGVGLQTRDIGKIATSLIELIPFVQDRVTRGECKNFGKGEEKCADSGETKGIFEFKWIDRSCWNILRGKELIDQECGTSKKELQEGTYTITSFGNSFVSFNVNVQRCQTSTVEIGGFFEFKWIGNSCWNILRGKEIADQGCGTSKKGLQEGTYTITSFGNSFMPFDVTVTKGQTTTVEFGGFFEFLWKDSSCWNILRGKEIADQGCGTGKIGLQEGTYTITSFNGNPDDPDPKNQPPFKPFSVTVTKGQTTTVSK